MLQERQYVAICQSAINDEGLVNQYRNQFGGIKFGEIHPNNLLWQMKFGEKANSPNFSPAKLSSISVHAHT